MNKEEIEHLLIRYQNGTATPEERAQLDLWYNQEVELSDWETEQDEQTLSYALKRKIDKEIDGAEEGFSSRINWYKYAAAIILVLFSAGGLYYYSAGQKTEVDPLVKNDIGPGGNKAILTLADGTKISLTDAGDGQLAKQAGIVVQKTADGQLVYTVADREAPAPGKVTYNMISTPRGGRYQINLPDGTAVWLNSASSLKFPVSFSGLNERKVELSGEAYFEVKKNKQPFRVVNDEQTVEVYGTHFNVMSYANEKVTETTLLEGKVGVKIGKEETFILPGQQTQLSKGRVDVLNNVDLDAAVAWKNEVFQFDNTDIDKVMRQIERWYDVDVTYIGRKPDVRFTGVIPRKANISGILKALEQTCDVKFEIIDQNITVTNKKTKLKNQKI